MTNFKLFPCFAASNLTPAADDDEDRESAAFRIPQIDRTFRAPAVDGEIPRLDEIFMNGVRL